MKVTSSLSREALESDRDLLLGSGALWNGAAPAALRKHYRTADDDESWRRWARHLARRRKPAPLAERFAGRRSPLAWAWPAEVTAEALHAAGPLALAAAGRAVKQRSAEKHWTEAARAWLERPTADDAGAAGALEALAWAYELPQMAAWLSPPLWWRMLTQLMAIAGDAGGIDLEAQPLVNQLLAGELPWALAEQFPELKPCHELATTASAALGRGIGELLDGEGLPQAGRLAIFRPLLACWTRARTIGGKATWDSAAEQQYSHALAELMRLSRADGRQVFASGTADAWSAKMLKQALRLVDSDRLARRARLVLPPARSRSGAVARPDKNAAVHGDWAEMAVLQPGWQCGGPKLTLAYSDRVCRVELEADGEILASGPWQFVLEADGRRLELDSEWEEICWVSDEDGDHVEIEAQLTDGFCLQRQLTLLRKDWVLLAADAVIGPTGDEVPIGARPVERLTHAMSLTLGEAMRVEPAGETREVWLAAKKRRWSVLPLSLPEWRSDRRRGELVAEDNRLVLRQQGLGQNLYAPLWIDLDRRRSKQGLTWRQLTVAENRQLLTSDVAVGYRAQVGRRQWLVYRSLVPPTGRTVLGQNLGTEFLLARFLRDGTIERRIEIE